MGITALLEGVCDQSHCPAEITHEVVEALLWPYYGHISRGGGCAYRALHLWEAGLVPIRGLHLIYLNKPRRSDSSPFIPVYSFGSGSYTSSDILWSRQITGGCSPAVKCRSTEGGISHMGPGSDFPRVSWGQVTLHHVLQLYICSAFSEFCFGVQWWKLLFNSKHKPRRDSSSLRHLRMSSPTLRQQSGR